MTSSSSLHPKLTALAWSLWAELGVSGWTRHHEDWLVDPEPLVLFTAALADADARLRDEATDWCVRYGSWLSLSRLTNLLEQMPAETQARYGELAATVAVHSSLRWRGATQPRPYQPTGRSRLQSLRSPSLISLRLRAVLGVGARAEVVRIFLGAPQVPRAASDLVDEAGFKKRNVADALEALRLGGVLDAERARNRLRYRLVDPKSWRSLLGPLPGVWPRWTRVLPVLAALADGMQRSRDLPTRARKVELDKLERELWPSIQAAAMLSPPAASGGGPLAEKFGDWTHRVVDALVHGDAAAFSRRTA
jgi:hypothetical protein